MATYTDRCRVPIFLIDENHSNEPISTVAPTNLTGEQRFVLTDVGWDFYLRCGQEIGERPLRLTFNDGVLEFMVTGSTREWFKTFLAKLVEMMVFELDRPVRSGGSFTIQREDLEKGFEPDECWWLDHEAEVRCKEDLDFTVDPPPDLAIEIEITSGLANRVGIYAAIGVPEIWRFDGREIRFCLLGDDGSYHEQPHSTAFPFLQPQHLLPYLDIHRKQDETARLREFVRWPRATETT